MSNFKLRTLTSVIGGAAMIGILVFGRELLLAVLLILALVGYYELSAALGVCKSGQILTPMTTIGYLSILAWYVMLELFSLEIISDELMMGSGIMLTVLSLMLHMSVYVLTFPRYDAARTIGSIFSVIYVPVMLSFLYMIRILDNGILYVWMVPIYSWGCDICAYLVGVKFGRHKMSPKLSPKKSVEGAIGGVSGSLIIGVVYALIAVAPRVETETWKVVAIFAVMSVCGALISMIGDLAASAIKRDHDIKDYGRLIPGHGGVCDRFDSFVFVAPLVYLICKLI